MKILHYLIMCYFTVHAIVRTDLIQLISNSIDCGTELLSYKHSPTILLQFLHCQINVTNVFEEAEYFKVKFWTHFVVNQSIQMYASRGRFDILLS